VSARIYIEGGSDSKELQARCREGFRRLLERCGLRGRMPRLVACGGRDGAFKDFQVAHRQAGESDYVAMLVDSEAPVKDVERTWTHLENRDGWPKPEGAHDEQVLLMTTSMETWIAADRHTLKEYFGDCLQQNALPSLDGMERQARNVVLAALKRATKTCKSPYRKGSQSFKLVGQLDPPVLRKHLPSFERSEAVLKRHLVP
jgi:hypothetical protein